MFTDFIVYVSDMRVRKTTRQRRRFGGTFSVSRGVVYHFGPKLKRVT